MENEYSGEFGCDPDKKPPYPQFGHIYDPESGMIVHTPNVFPHNGLMSDDFYPLPKLLVELFNDKSPEIEIGETVTILSFPTEELLFQFNGLTFTVIGINIQDEYDTELLLKGYPWLVYLRDVKKVSSVPNSGVE